MHKLISRQIRKFLKSDPATCEGLDLLLEKVGQSYVDYDMKLDMLQRSALISSEELSQANEHLRETAEAQKKLIQSLERSIASLSTKETSSQQVSEDTDLLKLAAQLESQTQETNRIALEKDQLLKNLAEQNEALNNYAHMVSHDLKSPIRNIAYLVSCMKEEEAENWSEGSDRYQGLIAENLEKIDALIDGILLHATVTTNQEAYVRLHTETLFKEIIKSIFVPDNIKITLKPPLPTLTIEKYKFELLFKNLLLNAITATENREKGAITVSCSENEKVCEFCVQDNGKGIEEKHQRQIFQMFKKLENNFRATGIGLALVKKIVNSFNGAIRLESAVDQGAAFYITLKK